MRFPLVSRWIFVFIRKKTGEAGLSCVSINPRPCHSEPVTDVTGVGIRNLLAGNLRKSAGIMRFGNGLPRQSVPQGHLLRGADWLAMTGFFDSLKRQPFGWRFCFIQYICIFIHLCAAYYRHSAQSEPHFPPFSHVPFVQIRLYIDFLCKNMLTFMHARCIVATVRRNSSEIHVYIPIHGIEPYII